MISAYLASLVSAFFTGATFYIHVAEQPARLKLDDCALLMEWKTAYKLGYAMQAPLALLGFLFGICAWYQMRKAPFLLGALLLIANWPWTLLVIKRVNDPLMATAVEHAGPASRALIVKWNAFSFCAFPFGMCGRIVVFLCTFCKIDHFRKRGHPMATQLRRIILACALACSALLVAQTPADDLLAPYIPKNLKPYYLDMLLSKDKPDTPLPEAERAQLMQKHLMFIRTQVEAGKFALVGRLTEESRLRGIAVIQAASLDEAQRIASADPLVQSGRLIVEVHPILLEDLSNIKFDYPPLK